MDWLDSLIGGVGDFFGGVGDTIGNLFGGVSDFAGDLFGGIGDSVGDLFGGDGGGLIQSSNLLGGAGSEFGGLFGGDSLFGGNALGNAITPTFGGAGLDSLFSGASSSPLGDFGFGGLADVTGFGGPSTGGMGFGSLFGSNGLTGNLFDYAMSGGQSGGSLLGTLAKGAFNAYGQSQNAKSLRDLANQMATRADPYQAQRGTAINQGLQALSDPRNNPLYNQSLAEGEQALKRRQAASGNFYSGGALEEAAQLPASVLQSLQNSQVQNSSQVANSASGSPAAAAELYGNARALANSQSGLSNLGSAFLAPFYQQSGQQSTGLSSMYGGL